MFANLSLRIRNAAGSFWRELRTAIRSDPDARWTLFSAAVAAVLLAYTKSPTGDTFSLFTDHLHHTRAAWTFFHLGLEAYIEPFSKTGREVYYPQPGITWGQLPIPYPPGMFVVFAPMALIGRYIPMGSVVYAKLAIVYMLVLMHAGLWGLVKLLRQQELSYFALLVLMLWIFGLRAGLQGFYDGAFLWTGVIATQRLIARRPASAIIWYTISGVISYRGAAFASFALLAVWQLLRSDASLARKASVLGFAAVGSLLTAGAFWLLMTHSTVATRHGAESSLLPLDFRGYAVIFIGAALCVALSLSASLLVGATAAVSTILCVLHAGHSWHGFVCFPVAMALAIERPKRDYAPLLVIVYIAFMWQFAFGYPPFHWLDELLRFIQRGGAYNKA